MMVSVSMQKKGGVCVCGGGLRMHDTCIFLSSLHHHPNLKLLLLSCVAIYSHTSVSPISLTALNAPLPFLMHRDSLKWKVMKV